jgi:hypothetical protein
MGSQFNAEGELADSNTIDLNMYRDQRRGCVGQKFLSGRSHITRRKR